MQRATGMIAFVFILYHVGHMHGWFHFEPWLSTMKSIGGAQFSPYNAASTASAALQGSIVVQLLYAIGVLASVFHLANGIWTMGITWGAWVTPSAQRWAGYACLVFGVGLGFVGLSALGGMMQVDVEKARAEENRMYEARVESGQILPNEHKRFHSDETNIAHQADGSAEPSSKEDEAN
jgi:succinate dehydrogenase / fumarate reductase cytochrome b subunit